MAKAVDQAYENLRGDILSGVHPVGTRLREEVLAAAIGTSRTPVREALRRLHAEGLVEVQPHRGAVVAGLGDDDIDDIFELRLLLEGYGARRAARTATSVHVRALERLCGEMEQCLDRPEPHKFDEIARLNLDFHRTLHAAGGNPRLLPLLSSLMVMPLVRHTFDRYSPGQLARSFSHHRELVAAIDARDPAWAEAVMHAHVTAARSSLSRNPLSTRASGPGR
jgi:DNA-binding GntR family transcriptional regulator